MSLPPLNTSFSPEAPAKVIFICSYNAWLRSAHTLATKGLIEPIYAVSFERNENSFLNFFPNIPFHDLYDAITGVPHRDFSHAAHATFSDDCQHIWKNEAQVVYDFIFRMSYTRAFSFQEMQRLFYQYIVYWNYIYDTMKPNLIAFDSIPHAGFDYVAYKLANHKGIATLTTGTSTGYKVPYFFAQDRFEIPTTRESFESLPITRYNSGVSSKDIDGRIDHVFEVIDKKIPELQRNEGVTRKLLFFDVFSEAAKQLQRCLKEYARGVLAIVGIKKAISFVCYYKQTGRALQNSYKGYFGYAHYLRDILIDLFVKKYRYFQYEKSTKKPELCEKYVYFPLSAQPEESTNPLADIFSYQMLIANIVAHALPNGWKLYIKENREQTCAEQSMGLFRNENYYSDLLSLPNTILISMEDNSFEYIRSAQAVAVIGGTSGLEALVSGIPCIAFGAPVYSLIKGCFCVSGFNDVKCLLNKIEHGAEVANRNEIRTFFKQAIERESLYSLYDWKTGSYRLDNAEFIESFTEALLNKLGHTSEKK